MSGKRGNGEGSIYPYKRNGVKVGYRGSYWVYTAEGPKRRYVSGKMRDDVRKKLTKAMADRDTGLVVDDKNMSFGEFLDAWISDSVRDMVRDSTLWRDKSLIANHIKPALGRIKLKNLNALHLQGMYRDRLDRGISEGKGLSGSTVQKIHHIVHKALGQAVKWDLIPRNPAESVKAPTPYSKEMRPLSADEARRLLRAAKPLEPPPAVVHAAATGRRTPSNHLPRSPAHVRVSPLLEERPSEVRPGTPRTRSGGDHPRHVLAHAPRHGRRGRRRDGRRPRIAYRSSALLHG